MSCKDCVHASKCETLLDNTAACEDYRSSCPLPRIGSKEWGWGKKPKYGANPKIFSPVTKYYLQDYYNTDEWYLICPDGEIVFGDCTLKDAKIAAEALIRAYWRRENRGKR